MPRPLSVTLVAGFLGAGKTSLLHHLISEQPGVHLALLVERTGELDFDAKALRGLCGAIGRTHDLVAEVDTAAEFAATVREIADRGQHERLLMEVGGLTLSSYWERAVADLPELARLENVVVLVDPLDPLTDEPDALAAFRRAQIERASLLVLNKCDLVEGEREEAVRRLRASNASARLIETAYGEVPAAEIFRPGWSGGSDLSSNGAAVSLPPLESVVYRAQRPFHPRRFWDWFNAPHAGLARVKGIVWLATRNLLVGGVSRTGRQNSCGAAGIWWAALPREEWPDDPERLMEMQATWIEPYGDRRQELLLIGEQGRAGDAARKLNLCLLSDAEFARPDWRELPDPFPEWDLEE